MKHVYTITKQKKKAWSPYFQDKKDTQNTFASTEARGISSALNRDIRGISGLLVHVNPDQRTASIEFYSNTYDLEHIQTGVEETLTENGYVVTSAKEISDKGETQ